MPLAAYKSPGVYVEEIPSAVKPISGVGTSTAGFIGISQGIVTIPEPNKDYDLVLAERLVNAKKENNIKDLRAILNILQQRTVAPTTSEPASVGRRAARGSAAPSTPAPGDGGGAGPGGPAVPAAATVPGAPAPATAQEPPLTDTEQKDLKGLEERFLRPDNPIPFRVSENDRDNLKVKLCTSYSDFIKHFGGFSADENHRMLAHAVYGFFNNGGTRCYVAWIKGDKGTADITPALNEFELIDEIAIVAAPGQIDPTTLKLVDDHCTKLGDRFAIFDSSPAASAPTGDLSLLDPGKTGSQLPQNSKNAAYYFPWIQVFDPATKIINPLGPGTIYVPPSGHMAGIYARVDTTRGVHKAPANELILGALGVERAISKNQQDGLNPQGVNCIRNINGNIRVWGARTLGGDANQDWKYIGVRRLFLFLAESIDEGTQWVVFEPNDRALWAKIERNVSAFLTMVWRDGALFGSTPQEAFYVKCDDETNPPESRDLGIVVTEIGIAIVRPAEFVVFRISQWAGPQSK